ncbi:hypothetical protein SRHO_G00068840 [Serrasalmus rhombeus]
MIFSKSTHCRNSYILVNEIILKSSSIYKQTWFGRKTTNLAALMAEAQMASPGIQTQIQPCLDPESLSWKSSINSVYLCENHSDPQDVGCCRFTPHRFNWSEEKESGPSVGRDLIQRITSVETLITVSPGFSCPPSMASQWEASE